MVHTHIKFCAIITIFFANFAQGNIADTLSKTLRQTCRAAELVSVIMATHFGLAMIHEGAHVATAKIAHTLGAETVGKNWRLALEPCNYAVCPTATYPIFKNESVNALIAGIAPMLGLAGCYGVLKINNIATEYKKEKSLKEALILGIKKSCINDEQQRGIQAVALIHAAGNAAHLLPLHIESINFECHGYQILKDLKDYLAQIFLAIMCI